MSAFGWARPWSFFLLNFLLVPGWPPETSPWRLSQPLPLSILMVMRHYAVYCAGVSICADHKEREGGGVSGQRTADLDGIG
eukprot:4809312-Pleurochrysis_carterae.AAC.4